MRWLACKKCGVFVPVANEDDPKDWEVPCERCGSKEWALCTYGTSYEKTAKLLQKIKFYDICLSCDGVGFLEIGPDHAPPLKTVACEECKSLGVIPNGEGKDLIEFLTRMGVLNNKKEGVQ